MPQRFPHSLPVAIVFCAGLACAAVTILDAYVAGTVSARVAYSGVIALALLVTGITGLVRPNIFRPIAVNLTLLAAGLLALQALLVPSRYVDGSKAYEIWRRGGPDAGTYPNAGPYNFLEAEVGVDDLSSLLRGGNDHPLPLGGPAHARLVVCNEDEGWFTFQSDRYGFNNPADVYDRLATERPIVIIGDSFVEGACTEENFADRLRHSLPVPWSISAKVATDPWPSWLRFVSLDWAFGPALLSGFTLQATTWVSRGPHPGSPIWHVS